MNLTQFGNNFAFELDADRTAPRRQAHRQDGKLPYRVAVPVIGVLSLSLWVVLWKLAAFAFSALFTG